MTILCFAGSLRQDSSNKKLARHAARHIEQLGLVARSLSISPTIRW